MRAVPALPLVAVGVWSACAPSVIRDESTARGRAGRNAGSKQVADASSAHPREVVDSGHASPTSHVRDALLAHTGTIWLVMAPGRCEGWTLEASERHAHGGRMRLSRRQACGERSYSLGYDVTDDGAAIDIFSPSEERDERGERSSHSFASLRSCQSSPCPSSAVPIERESEDSVRVDGHGWYATKDTCDRASAANDSPFNLDHWGMNELLTSLAAPSPPRGASAEEILALKGRLRGGSTVFIAADGCAGSAPCSAWRFEPDGDGSRGGLVRRFVERGDHVKLGYNYELRAECGELTLTGPGETRESADGTTTTNALGCLDVLHIDRVTPTAVEFDDGRRWFFGLASCKSAPSRR